MTNGVRGWRPGAFILGLVAGGAVAVGAVWIAWPFPPFGWWSVSAEINGHDVDRHGGARIVLSDGLSRITQRCAGGCDDVQLRQSTGEGDYEVKVLDARGVCVACDNAGYVTDGLPTDLVISGEDALHVKGGMAGLTPTPVPSRPAAGREIPTR
ncbi:MAG: hypothetical protein EPO51_16560 [Phenylobacterium sp.]|uniref:hypothetical protein n=1 Tax=Phenylobacterium sp. TaxID=1871053 RepID=UPI0011F5EF62|nr:hypothetical protein [Phenylobacterium sp.]TAJ70701.1 MAG: hypothetical protein EPO51_16560 [Phenylobacterium sp.]